MARWRELLGRQYAVAKSLITDQDKLRFVLDKLRSVKQFGKQTSVCFIRGFLKQCVQDILLVYMGVA